MRSIIREEVESADARRRLLHKAYRMDMLGEIRREGYAPWSEDKIKQWIANNQEE